MVGRAEVIALGVTLPVIDGVILALRLISRKNRACYGLDDLFAVLAYIFLLPNCAVLIYGTIKYGYGQRSVATQAGYTNQLPITLGSRHLSAIAQLIFPWAVGSSKLSMLFFYRRIFKGRVFSITLWLLVFVVTGWTLSMFLSSALQCGTHISYLWGSAEKVATSCLEGEPIALSLVTLDFVSDLAIIIFPIHWTSKMQMHKTRKILVLIVFAFGALAVIASLARLIVFVILFPGHNHNQDQLAYITSIPYYEALEVGLAIVAICLPAMGGFLSDDGRTKLIRWVNNVVPARFRTLRDLATTKPASRGLSKKNKISPAGGPDGWASETKLRDHELGFDDPLRAESGVSSVGLHRDISTETMKNGDNYSKEQRR